MRYVLIALLAGCATAGPSIYDAAAADCASYRGTPDFAACYEREVAWRRQAILQMLGQPIYRPVSRPATTTCQTYGPNTAPYAGGNIVCQTK